MQMYVMTIIFYRFMQNDHFKIHQYCTDQSQEKSMLFTTNLTGRNYSRTIVSEYELADSKNRYSHFHNRANYRPLFDLMKDANRLGNVGNLKELKFEIEYQRHHGKAGFPEAQVDQNHYIVSKEMWFYKFEKRHDTRKVIAIIAYIKGELC